MTDPALLYQEGYAPYDRGVALDIFLKFPDGTPSIGLVWPGVTVFPGNVSSFLFIQIVH